MSAPVTVTYFVEVLSSWCHWAEPAWQELRQRYAGRVNFRWRIALMRPEDFPVSASQCDAFYRRSGTHVVSPYMLHSGWFEPERAGHYEAPNWVVEAGRDLLGEEDERIRLALSQAAVREGRRIGDLATAVSIAAEATGLDASTLQQAAESDTVQDRVAASTQLFFDHQLTQRPAFILESTIGDKAVFSGLWTVPPLATTLDAMLDDVARYTSHTAHQGEIPPA
jgi:predicted DsbA family dithiol-disulfide isomerase